MTDPKDIAGLIERAQAWIDNDNLPLTAELTKQLVDRIRELEAEREVWLAQMRGHDDAIAFAEAGTIERCVEAAAKILPFGGLLLAVQNAIRALAKPT
jgi:hypothetical protein